MRGSAVYGVALSHAETKVYNAIKEAAEGGLPCPQNIDFEILTDSSSSSMGPALVRRLEEKGLIRVIRFQRWRQVQVMAIGKWTAPPPNANAKPHVARGKKAQ